MRESDGIRILRSAERFLTTVDGIVTRHCFAFGEHYDPGNTGFGELVAVNDEYVDPGRGYELHRHRDTEIVTWVLDGVLEHEDSEGNAGTIGVGTIQRMSAGTGVRHAERNASAELPVRFVQMWLRAADPDTPPSYQQAGIAERLRQEALVPAVGPAGDAVIGIGNTAATLWIARLDDSGGCLLPDAPQRHVHVVRGSVDAAGQTLEAGDTMRVTGERRLPVESREPSELLLWAMRPSS